VTDSFGALLNSPVAGRLSQALRPAAVGYTLSAVQALEWRY